jgi:parallel beta helix pectate lyase-like protein
MKKMKKRSIIMGKNRLFRASVFATLLSFILLPGAAHAANVTVGCPGGSGGTYASITDALNAIGQTGPSTITVTGTCQEKVSLNNARSITIISGPSGASVVGPLDTDTFDISLSQDITLWSLNISGTFSTTGNGGGAGVSITEASDVHILGCNIHDNQAAGVVADGGSIVSLQGTTIQYNTPNDGLEVNGNSKVTATGSIIQYNGSLTGSTNGPHSSGIFAGSNSQVFINGRGSLVQYNADRGIVATGLSQVLLGGRGTIIQGNGTKGILVIAGSHLQVNSSGTVIQDNGSVCPLDPTCGGIFATQDSTVVLTGTISGNHGSGVSVQQGSNVQLNNATVSNNTGDGVHIQWLSIGDFGSGNTIIGNGGASIFCAGRSFALGNLSTFSNVRCGEN